MAGEVRCDAFHVPGVTVLKLVAYQCPVTERYGELCLVFDPSTGEVKVCPFLYGLVVQVDAHHGGEARSLQEMREWLASQELYSVRTYTVRCLRKESAGVRVGALSPRG